MKRALELVDEMVGEAQRAGMFLTAEQFHSRSVAMNGRLRLTDQAEKESVKANTLTAIATLLRAAAAWREKREAALTFEVDFGDVRSIYDGNSALEQMRQAEDAFWQAYDALAALEGE